MVLPMAETSRHVRVVAAVIERDGKYLITQRRTAAVLAGLWEFPGGKVEPGETDEDALRRELVERMGVEVDVQGLIARRTHQYEGYSVDLTLYRAVIRPGNDPRALRIADFRWVASSDFDKYPFPAADQATMDLLLGFRR